MLGPHLNGKKSKRRPANEGINGFVAGAAVTLPGVPKPGHMSKLPDMMIIPAAGIAAGISAPLRS